MRRTREEDKTAGHIKKVISTIHIFTTHIHVRRYIDDRLN